MSWKRLQSTLVWMLSRALIMTSPIIAVFIAFTAQDGDWIATVVLFAILMSIFLGFLTMAAVVDYLAKRRIVPPYGLRPEWGIDSVQERRVRLRLDRVSAASAVRESVSRCFPQATLETEAAGAMSFHRPRSSPPNGRDASKIDVLLEDCGSETVVVIKSRYFDWNPMAFGGRTFDGGLSIQNVEEIRRDLVRRCPPSP